MCSSPLVGRERERGPLREATAPGTLTLLAGAAGTGRPHRDRRLSPREGEITDPAARGRTNRETAELPHLSPRTVETHVADALSKLGLRSRRDPTPPPDRPPRTARGPAAPGPRAPGAAAPRPRGDRAR